MKYRLAEKVASQRSATHSEHCSAREVFDDYWAFVFALALVFGL
jgi:hypothetical protein